MNIADWDDFNKKNKDKTKAFEDLCRLLFLREKKKSTYEYVYDTNEAGLEFKPIQCEDNKWYGIQCKYFSNDINSSKKYDEIYKSIHQAIKNFKGQLDVIYIYTNGQFKENYTQKEMEKAKAKGKLTKKLKIWDECNKNKIELKWIKTDNILDDVKSKANLDLYKLYFTDERELDFLINLISPKEKTFLKSDEFLDLNFEKNVKISEIKNKIYKDKFSLILGEAGTGKSLTIKQICNLILEEYTEVYLKKIGEIKGNVTFPILIKLKECTNGNIEDIIRNRLRDYNISKTNGEKRICYLFDGLDEIPINDITSVINYIVRLKDDSETQSIIISSRCDSNNLIYLRQINEWNEYKIQDLSDEQKRKFFENKKSLIKIDQLKKIEKSKLIGEITDIFSLKLLWENIEDIDIEGGKIELIEKSMNHLFDTYQKITNINILYPKQKRILDVCTEIAYIMQVNNKLFLHLTEIQKIIKDTLMMENANAINSVIDMLLDTCFEMNFSYNMSFKHRRIQEYFLYRKIEKEYYINPSVLRNTNILANRDFMCNVFLQTSIKRVIANRDLFKILCLRLLESYLGREYVKGFANKLITGDRNCNVYASYKYSERLYDLLSTYDINELENLFIEDKLGILDVFQDDNYIKLVKIYYENNNKNISELIKKYVPLKEKIRWSEEVIYYLLKIVKRPIDSIYDDIKEDKKLLTYLFNLAIREDLKFIINKIEELDNVRLEALCNVILDFENIDILYNKEKYEELFELIKSKILKETCFVKAKVLFSLISTNDVFKEDLKNEFKKYNINHFWTWVDNLEISIYMAILLEESDRLYLGEFKFSTKLIQALYDNKGNDAFILESFKKILIENNYIYRDTLKYTNTRVLAIILSRIDFDLHKIKRFLRVIFNYQSVINVNELIFKIYKLNRKLFKNIINESILFRLEKNVFGNQNGYYEEEIDSIFSLGAMYSEFNMKKRHELLIKGIGNSICRPEYKGETFVSDLVTECIYRGYEEYWYDEDLLKEYVFKIYSNLKIIENRTENYDNMQVLKWIAEECDINIDNFDELKDVKGRAFDYIDYKTQFDSNLINLDNLIRYYEFDYIEGTPYGSIEFWKYIIDIGHKNKKISILINNLSKRLYGQKLDYVYIPIMILLSYDEYKDNIWEILANEFGRFGIYTIIKIISFDNNFGDGMKYIKHLIEFSEFLTKNSISNNKKLSNEDKEVEWFKYRKEDWQLNESENEIYFKKDKNIRIVWNEYEGREEFFEEWATNNINKNAYKYNYVIYVNNNTIKEFSLVWVDGYRALLPMPKKYGENLVRRDEYLICRLLNNNVEELNRYMRSSGLRVE